ncbi:hypothetical protein CEXT_572411 [Caerostris extrusa]|uniref:Uncharacterized protein n=1 Tax=Caerostris extrusa TaxID=172846 RepID=A0AAV4MRM1_CAEEX|nr:hypothetical protein CEXT_572411 [Caerostris extrusa]
MQMIFELQRSKPPEYHIDKVKVLEKKIRQANLWTVRRFLIPVEYRRLPPQGEGRMLLSESVGQDSAYSPH